LILLEKTDIFAIVRIHEIGEGKLAWSPELICHPSRKGVLIGDRLSDINAAKSNGLLAIGCNFDFTQEDELSQANIKIDSLLELKIVIDALNAEDTKVNN
jgi:phosphoglycolate phosphatase-like HAD superfamily hydrolase